MSENKGIVGRLQSEGSLLSAYKGETPPKVADIDPTVSVNSTQLSNYKGETPSGYLDNPPR
jgi:hypothetical protein